MKRQVEVVFEYDDEESDPPEQWLKSWLEGVIEEYGLYDVEVKAVRTEGLGSESEEAQTT